MAGIGIATGTLVTLQTTTWTGEFLDITIDGITRTAVDISHMATTGYKPYAFSGITDGGTITLAFLYDPTDHPPFATGASETLTISPGGDATNTLVATGAFVDCSLGLPFEDKMAGAVQFKVSSWTLN